LTGILENPEGYSVSEEEQETLTQLFNRGFTQGYFFENPALEAYEQGKPSKPWNPSRVQLKGMTRAQTVSA